MVFIILYYMPMKTTEKQMLKKLEEVMDPELNMSIVDLGLVYKTSVKGDKATVLMTLTTIGCPLFSLIEQDVKNKLQELGFSDKNIEIELTFDPPWSIDRLTEKAKALLGI